MHLETILDNEELLSRLFSIEKKGNESMLLGTMDELIKLLWSFFNGNSDQFSLYSCLYLYDEIRSNPENKKCETLYLFIDAVKGCCGYARKIVALSGNSEDEDWSKSVEHNLNLSNIDQISKDLKKKINEFKQSMNANKKKSENSQPEKFVFEQQIIHRFEFIASLLFIMKEMYDVANMFELDENG